MTSDQVEGFRLSPQQKHLWHLQARGSESAYRAQGAVEIEGEVDRDVLEKAVRHVVCRYEILNTTFRRMPGLSVPVQVINPPNGVVCSEHDLLDRTPEEQRAAVEQALASARQAPLDWERGPLLQLACVRLAPSRVLLQLCMPAMCADALTLRNLGREIAATYSALRSGQPLEAEDPLQFADIAEWQNELIESEEGERETEYWYQKILAAPLAVKLPFEKQVHDGPEFITEAVETKLGPDLVAALDAVAGKHGVSPASLFLACWEILLQRYTGQSEMMFGVGCDGRGAEELSGAVGLFAKCLPHPCRLDDDMHLRDVLQEVERSLSEGIERQEYFCWEKFGATAESDLALGYFPLSFEYATAEPRQRMGDAEISIKTPYVCLERFHLKLACIRGEDTIETKIHFDSSLFDRDSVNRLAEQFQVLLSGVAAAPEAEIGSYNTLTESERRQLIVEFNDTAQEFPDGRCMHHMIEERAAAAPDSLAVIFADEQMTYAEFDARANQMANHLQKLGVGPDVMVGLFMEPSIEIMVGLLGILKAGGAYVPIDPEYPQERLDFILKDTEAPVLLTQERLVRDMGPREIHTICLDTQWEKIGAESSDRPACEMTADNLAYVIYTSGSTGVPKGVLVTHRNLVHSTYARELFYEVPVGRYLLLSSFSFDSSVAGIFWTLMQGGALVLPEAGTQRDPHHITDLIARHEVTHTLCLASHYALIMSEAVPEKMVSLKTNIVSGEVFSMALVDRHDALAPQSKLYNEYGPTEGSVWCIAFDCHDPFQGIQLPIGKPIANTQIYILNSHLQPVPIGAPGEIYIGGVGVTKGYLKRPELTKERFVPDPFSGQPGAKLYKSGDAARYLPDGNMDFLGRGDDQVKIRGYRIELGEIEAVLGRHPQVQEVAVLAREDTPGEKRLVAYLATANNEDLTVGSLRDYLSEHVPDYMVPAAFVFMEKLPRTPIGKLDRKALPVPAKARPHLESAFVAPETALEKVLANIAAEALGIEKVGVKDSFFELGAHSILITQLAARVRETLSAEVPLRSIFEAPSIAGMCDVLLQDQQQGATIEKKAELVLRVAELSDSEAEALLDE